MLLCLFNALALHSIFSPFSDSVSLLCNPCFCNSAQPRGLYALTVVLICMRNDTQRSHHQVQRKKWGKLVVQLSCVAVLFSILIYPFHLAFLTLAWHFKPLNLPGHWKFSQKANPSMVEYFLEPYCYYYYYIERLCYPSRHFSSQFQDYFMHELELYMVACSKIAYNNCILMKIQCQNTIYC